jgi:hypothetical protein
VRELVRLFELARGVVESPALQVDASGLVMNPCDVVVVVGGVLRVRGPERATRSAVLR